MTPDARLDRARRLLRTQEQLRRAAEIERAQTRDRIGALEADRAALLASLSACAGGHLLLDAAARRLRGLAGEAADLAATAARQDEAVRERGLGAKRAESLVERLAQAQRREDERREILDRLDGIACPPPAPVPGPGDASLP